MSDEVPSQVICATCGSVLPMADARRRGWLVGQLPGGRWVMRCPKHQSAHSRRLLGLPGRVAMQRAVVFIQEYGQALRVCNNQVWWVAFARDELVEARDGDEVRTRYFMTWDAGDYGAGFEEFDSLRSMVLAMSQLRDLRFWEVVPAPADRD